MLRDFVLLSLSMVTLWLFPGTALSQEAAPPPVGPLDQVYKLVADDRIEIYVEGHEKLTRQYVVPANGEVSFPPIGKINLLGKTQDDLAAEIKQQFIQKGHLQDPIVYVLIVAHAPTQVFLLGAVNRTLSLPVHTHYGILEVLAMAGIGGIGREPGAADLRRVKVRRRAENGKLFWFPVNVEDALRGADNRKDVRIFPNDLIHIPVITEEEEGAAVYIFGEVAKPGKYTWQPERGQMTLTTLIILAGDLEQYADESRIRILRREGNRYKVTRVDFDEIIDGEADAFQLEPGDTVYVPESDF
jgi:polysaccharide export outer membrane protein